MFPCNAQRNMLPYIATHTIYISASRDIDCCKCKQRQATLDVKMTCGKCIYFLEQLISRMSLQICTLLAQLQQQLKCHCKNAALQQCLRDGATCDA